MDYTEIKEILLQMQTEILEELSREHNISKVTKTVEVGDEIDLATDERAMELFRLFSKRDQRKLKNIRNALEKIESNDYGICEECGDPISEKRLKAVPFARLCFDCQSSEEINYRDDSEEDIIIDYENEEETED